MLHIKNVPRSLAGIMTGILACIAVLFLPVSNALAVEGLTLPKTDAPTITVGGPNADIPAYTSRAIQIAVDAIREIDGGVVRLGIQSRHGHLPL